MGLQPTPKSALPRSGVGAGERGDPQPSAVPGETKPHTCPWGLVSSAGPHEAWPVPPSAECTVLATPKAPASVLSNPSAARPPALLS